MNQDKTTATTPIPTPVITQIPNITESNKIPAAYIAPVTPTNYHPLPNVSVLYLGWGNFCYNAAESVRFWMKDVSKIDQVFGDGVELKAEEVVKDGRKDIKFELKKEIGKPIFTTHPYEEDGYRINYLLRVDGGHFADKYLTTEQKEWNEKVDF